MYTPQIQTVAIVGAGITAAVLATLLNQRGIAVDLYEKSRGAGGRLATRRAGDALFNHGCPVDAGAELCLSAENHEGRPSDKGCCEPTSTNAMESPLRAANTIVKERLAGHRVHCGIAVARLERSEATWTLVADTGQTLGTADAVVLTAPAPQARLLLPDTLAGWRTAMASVRYSPCWAAMFCTGESIKPDPAVIRRLTPGHIDPNADPAPPSAWVAHATPEFSQAHLELSPDEVLPKLLDACGLQLNQTTLAQAHRWRYALCLNPITEDALWDTQLRIGIAGDAFGNHSQQPLQRAIRSAQICAQRLLNIVARDCRP